MQLLCAGGIPRVAKLLVAVATSGAGSRAPVSLVDTGTVAELNGDYSSLEIHSVIEEDVSSAKSACTRMAFDNFSAHIALLRDSGALSVVNIEAGSVYAQLIPDGAGVVDLRYSNAGKMFTLGRSARGQIQVWDIRGAGGAAGAGGYAKVHSVRLPAMSVADGQPVQYSCITPHATIDHYVYCGDSSGIVHEIDLRTASISHSFKAHGGQGIVKRHFTCLYPLLFL